MIIMNHRHTIGTEPSARTNENPVGLCLTLIKIENRIHFILRLQSLHFKSKIMQNLAANEPLIEVLHRNHNQFLALNRLIRLLIKHVSILGYFMILLLSLLSLVFVYRMFWSEEPKANLWHQGFVECHHHNQQFICGYMSR